MLVRTVYSKATVKNVGNRDLSLPDEFRYLGGRSYTQHGDSNVVSGSATLNTGQRRVIELSLAQQCPRAPVLTSGGGYGY